MRVLLYYTSPDSYQEAMINLSVNQNDVSLRWADGFKEAHRDRCQSVYIMPDVSAVMKERITKHYTETMGVEVFHIDEGDGMPQGEEISSEDWTLETIETYISELEDELEKANGIREGILETDKAAQQLADTERAREAKAQADAAIEKANREKAEAKAAEELAAKEAQESADAQAKADKLKKEAEEAAALVGTTNDESGEGETNEGGETETPPTPGLSIEQLRSELDLLGVKYTQRNTKPELQALLQNALAQNNGE